MKLACALAASLLAALSLPGQGNAEEFHLAAPVTDFQLVDLQGAPHAFASLKGDTTVVVFIAVRCPVSNAYNQRMEALYQDYSPKGVKFLFVNANVNEPSPEVKEHARQVGFTFPVYRDSGNVAELFNAQVTPETYVIDKQGIIRYHGAIDDSQNVARIRKQSLRAALDEVLAGKPVTVAETKAFGCSVKRPVLIARLSKGLLALNLLAGQLIPLDQPGFARMLESHRGKVVLVDFWATWCDPCREELPKLVALQKKLQFELITVSADEPEQEPAASDLLDREHVPQPRYIKHSDDDQLFIDSVDKKWSGALPALFLYDRQGKRVASFIGESDEKDIEAALRKTIEATDEHR